MMVLNYQSRFITKTIFIINVLFIMVQEYRLKLNDNNNFQFKSQRTRSQNWLFSASIVRNTSKVFNFRNNWKFRLEKVKKSDHFYVQLRILYVIQSGKLKIGYCNLYKCYKWCRLALPLNNSPVGNLRCFRF